MDRWEVIVRVFPHSSGEGAGADLAACGGKRFRSMTVVAENAAAAMRQADILRQGIETNPRVWKTEVVKVERGG